VLAQFAFLILDNNDVAADRVGIRGSVSLKRRFSLLVVRYLKVGVAKARVRYGARLRSDSWD